MTIQAGLEGAGEPEQERNIYLMPKASPRTEAVARPVSRTEDSDDGYDAMRDDWTGSGNDWRFSRPNPRRSNQRRRY
jgi:hypothetical protein